ncbi:ABC-2 type transport system permease protein [Dysgonomonas sp. PFB1-18]|uniref:ABC transporter permease n=1 Tax=unclassified Dysgonomonas TaxID=2630389 RepID=UPI00247360EB|nr:MULTISPECIES: ABC transporter permease [unclassified Dysgonomonas]MDH6310951.1 ABC-2 type transport system permease protein [Dysgonomonas sp. PF1-14]MDH6340834.1 ABC-2 type transport system permease protein [Dysgonomonas sp. PF1-16]MDH6382474.1 ABC-2 type transport system permease protein [Dysgonomonas sp. PFB1-18]MDH6399823.1 ABC-2 type transport system permease protein [Dysgonomonas sp. PF1-23]
MKIFIVSVYYQLLSFLRIKPAVFMTIFFPVFLFCLFSVIWGMTDPAYVFWIYTGVLGMTLLNEGFFAIGPLLKEYYISGLTRYLNKMPFNFIIFFIALIFGRLLVMLILLICLSIIVCFWGLNISIEQFLWIVFGLGTGFILFSFIGLILSFASIKYTASRNITNLLQLIILFMSNTFYPLNEYNKILGTIGDILPLNPVLELMRNGTFHYSLFIWLLASIVLFYIMFKEIKFSR